METKFAVFMKARNQYISFAGKISSIGMILSLVWLTVSLPFVYEARQQFSKSVSGNTNAGKEDNNNPFGNTTEEKTPPTVNEEYLHHQEELIPSFSILNLSFKEYIIPSYSSHKCELISPPPEA